jgi:hypothetical protein
MPSFDILYIFKTLQMIESKGQVSRTLLSKELALGEGEVRTLVKHLQTGKIVETSKHGTKMTAKGRAICSELMSSIPCEIALPRCSVALGKFNYAVLIKSHDYSIKSGLEQRDAAIKMGGTGATTLLFKDRKFIMPVTTSKYDCLETEPKIRQLLLGKLKPQEGDVIIIGSSDDNEKKAELAAKNAVLFTIMNHNKHTPD